MDRVAMEKWVRSLLDDQGVTVALCQSRRSRGHWVPKLRYSPLDKELSGMILIKEDTPIIVVNSWHHSNRHVSLSRTKSPTYCCIAT